VSTGQEHDEYIIWIVVNTNFTLVTDKLQCEHATQRMMMLIDVVSD